MEVKRDVLVYVEAIPHKSQRYSTVGDFIHLPNGLHVSVSDTGNKASNMLVAIHEIVEAFLTEVEGISDKSIDDFDMRFEANRTPESLEEPGDSPDAPYHIQHVLADAIERLVALHAGVNWQEHEARIEALDR